MQFSRRTLFTLVGAGAIAPSALPRSGQVSGEEKDCTVLDLQNAGFEEPVTGGTIPGWHQRHGSGGLAVGTAHAIEGSQALHVHNATGEVSLASSAVPITPGLYYAVTAQGLWFSGQIQLHLGFYDEAGLLIGESERIFEGQESDQWYWLGIGAHAPDEAASAEVLIHSALDGADYWIDDVQIIQTHPRIETHALAAEVLSLIGMSVMGEKAYVVSRNQRPAVLAEYDLPSHTLTQTWDLTEADGAWAMTNDGRNVYIAAHSGGRVFILDSQTGDVRALPVFGTSDMTAYGMELAQDGYLYVATYPDAAVWQVDPESGEAQQFVQLDTSATYARALALEGTDLVVGTSPEGGLYHVDLITGAATDITPPSAEPGLGWVTLDLMDGVVHAAQGAEVIRVDLTGELTGSWSLEGSQIDVLRQMPDGSVFAAVRPDGAIYRLGPDAQEFSLLGAPAEGQEHREIAPGPAGEVLGLAGDGALWAWHGEADFTVDELWREEELVGPTLVQDLCLTPTGVAASASGIVLHHTNRPQMFVPTAATPIRLAFAEGSLYTATYPRTEIIRVSLNRGETETLAEIGSAQSRPWSMYHDVDRRSLVICTEGSGSQGAVSLFHLRSHEVTTWAGVLGDRAVTTAIADGSRTFIAGGLGGPELDAAVGEIDLDSGEMLWTIEPVPGLATIESINILDGILYGVVRGNRWFAYDVDAGELLRVGWLSGTHSYGNLQIHHGRVILPAHYGMVFELDLDQRDAQLLLDGFEEGWRRGPKLLFNGEGDHAWGMSGMNLARFDLSDCHMRH